MIQLTVNNDQLQASWRLLQRVFPAAERILPKMIFNTTEPPYPPIFTDPNHPITQDLIHRINDTMVAITTAMAVNEWHLNPDQVDQLTDMADPRINILRQRIRMGVDAMPIVQKLQVERAQKIASTGHKK